nr:ACP S-malonyltransferase [uncultured Clostridium sp.]
MENKLIFLFSGQGSQYYHMAKELYETQEIFRKHLDQLDHIAEEQIHQSVIKIMYNTNKKKNDVFDRLVHTHMALFMVQYSLAQVFISNGIKPDYIIGSSLGEYVGMAVAGVLSVEDAVRVIVNQAKSIEKNCEEGHMISILSNSDFYYSSKLHQYCECISENKGLNFVVSLVKENYSQVCEILKEYKVSYQVLPVKYGFHSKWIEAAKSDFLSSIEDIELKRPNVAYGSCAEGKIKKQFYREYLWDVIRCEIQFSELLTQAGEGISNSYLDLSPSGTQANIIKHCKDISLQAFTYSILSPLASGESSVNQLGSVLYRLKEEESKKSMKVFMFPGQGSQSRGMGGELFDEFREYTAVADRILGYSIKQLCLEDPDHVLDNTRYTQPALFVVNAFHYLKELKDYSEKPSYLIGHSLGEFNALFASGVFDFETGLRIVKKRGELMNQVNNGTMAAVIGISNKEVERILSSYDLDAIDIANYNTLTQTVVAGTKEDISRAKSIFEAEGAKAYVILNVSGAFHSRYMLAAQNEFAQFVDQFEFAPMTIPVIANINGETYKNQDIKTNIVHQMTNPVRWVESIRFLARKGNAVFVSIGPGNVVKKLTETILSEMPEESMEEEAAIPEISIPETSATIASENKNMFFAASLGNSEFKKEYGLKYAYIAGSMYRGISSKDMVVKMSKAGMLAFFGTGGLSVSEVETAIQEIKRELSAKQPYGLNLLASMNSPKQEEELVDLYLKHQVTIVEASAFINVTLALVKYRVTGLKKDFNGDICVSNKIIAKVSRPEVAEIFLNPPPQNLIDKLLMAQKITYEEAQLSREIPMCDDLCVEADSGGHTDQGVSFALIPALMSLRNRVMEKKQYAKKVRVGVAGGIGSPESAAAAFVLGADFILTGSINQCTVEAGTSSVVKSMLQDINIQDTDYAPAGDMFEMGAKVQVLRKGLFFPARANKLYDLYKHCNSLEEIDDKTREQIQKKYFKKNFEEVYEEIKVRLKKNNRYLEIEKAESNAKYKLSLVFRWYFNAGTKFALLGDIENKVDFQVHCGPALGAFNQLVKDTELEKWENRYVDKIAVLIMENAAKWLNTFYQRE